MELIKLVHQGNKMDRLKEKMIMQKDTMMINNQRNHQNQTDQKSVTLKKPSQRNLVLSI
jgi:hypothetical protein